MLLALAAFLSWDRRVEVDEADESKGHAHACSVPNQPTAFVR